MATGGIYALRDGRGNPDTFSAVYEYPRGFEVVFQARLHTAAGGVREVYASEAGTIDLQEGRLPAEGSEEIVPAGSPAGAAHLANFLDCVRSRGAPSADVVSGYQHAVAICMAMESFHTGKRVAYDQLGEKLVV